MFNADGGGTITLERIAMDGRNAKKIVDSDVLAYPTGTS